MFLLGILGSCNKRLNVAMDRIQESKASNHQDSMATTLLNRFDLVVGIYRIPRNIRSQDNYYVAFSKKSATAYHLKLPVFISTGNNSAIALDSVPLTRQTYNEVLDVFDNAENWNVDYDDTKDEVAMEDCTTRFPGKQCIVIDGPSYLLTFNTRRKNSHSQFYAPGRFEECCPGNPNRKKFMYLKRQFEQIFNLDKPL